MGLEFVGKNTEEVRAAQKGSCRDLPNAFEFGQELISACIGENHLRKETPESSRQNNPQSSYQAENSSYSHWREWKDLIIHRASGRILRGAFPQLCN